MQTTLKIAKSKEAASLPKEAKATPLPTAAVDLEAGVGPDEHQALLAQQQQQQQQQQERSVLESRLQYNDALIDERDEGIQDIQRNIQDIQEMFQVCFMSLQAHIHVALAGHMVQHRAPSGLADQYLLVLACCAVDDQCLKC